VSADPDIQELAKEFVREIFAAVGEKPPANCCAPDQYARLREAGYEAPLQYAAPPGGGVLGYEHVGLHAASDTPFGRNAGPIYSAAQTMAGALRDSRRHTHTTHHAHFVADPNTGHVTMHAHAYDRGADPLRAHDVAVRRGKTVGRFHVHESAVPFLRSLDEAHERGLAGYREALQRQGDEAMRRRYVDQAPALVFADYLTENGHDDLAGRIRNQLAGWKYHGEAALDTPEGARAEAVRRSRETGVTHRAVERPESEEERGPWAKYFIQRSNPGTPPTAAEVLQWLTEQGQAPGGQQQYAAAQPSSLREGKKSAPRVVYHDDESGRWFENLDHPGTAYMDYGAAAAVSRYADGEPRLYATPAGPPDPDRTAVAAPHVPDPHEDLPGLSASLGHFTVGGQGHSKVSTFEHRGQTYFAKAPYTAMFERPFHGNVGNEVAASHVFHRIGVPGLPVRAVQHQGRPVLISPHVGTHTGLGDLVWRASQPPGPKRNAAKIMLARMSRPDAAKMAFGNWLINADDRHGGNYVMTHKLHNIDYGMAFHPLPEDFVGWNRKEALKEAGLVGNQTVVPPDLVHGALAARGDIEDMVRTHVVPHHEHHRMHDPARVWGADRVMQVLKDKFEHLDRFKGGPVTLGDLPQHPTQTPAAIRELVRAYAGPRRATMVYNFNRLHAAKGLGL